MTTIANGCRKQMHYFDSSINWKVNTLLNSTKNSYKGNI